MRKRANVFSTIGAIVALFPIASLATDGGDPGERIKQEGEDRWVPSMAIISGVTIQRQQGMVASLLSDDGMAPVPLRDFINGNDIAVSPFVGGSLELMTPALPIRTRPRLFLSGEILPTFAANRTLAIEGDPGCVRGPEPDAPCARDEDGSRDVAFGEDSANGEGSQTTAEIQSLVFGASLGVAIPFRVGERQLRIKPSIGWINYKVKAEGLVVDANCDPQDVCTDFTFLPGFPPIPGFLRETILTASESKRFNGIGPGLDIEMDTGRYGPLGVSLFAGARAYYLPGDRDISFTTVETFDDQLGMDTAAGQFEVEVAPWMYRAHVGIRLQWLGSQK